MNYLGVDLGGTNIKAALVSEAGEILAEASRPTGLPRSAEAICDDIAELCRELQAQSEVPVEGLGVGCPGTVDGDMILYSNNLDWHDFNMGGYLKEKTGLPVCIANDANTAALGEALAGCAKGAHSAVILTLGTGVGGGVVLDGKLLTGYTGAAAEPGHTVIDPNGPLCTCGRRGCLECYASATGLIRMTKEAMQSNPHSIMNRTGTVDGKTAFDAARQGDEAGRHVVDSYIHALAIGVANLTNVFFPEVVGLSGGVAKEGEGLLAPLREAVQPMLYGHAYARKHTRIVACTLGYKAGVIGAALLMRGGRNHAAV